MKKNSSKELAPRRKWGLRRWNDAADSPFDLFLRDREGFHRELDRLFEDFWQGNGRSSLLAGPWAVGELSPSVDQTEDEKAYHIKVELPGMEKDEVDISFSDSMLTISGEKKEEKEEKDKDYYRKERSFGEFRRILSIPGAVDDTKIQATFKNGVLSIELPKTKEAQNKVKKIAIK